MAIRYLKWNNNVCKVKRNTFNTPLETIVVSPTTGISGFDCDIYRQHEVRITGKVTDTFSTNKQRGKDSVVDKMYKFPTANDRLRWKDDLLKAKEIAAKFGPLKTPEYLMVSEGILRNDTAKSVHPFEVLRVHGRICHERIAVVFISAEQTFSETLSFPINSSARVFILPPYMTDEHHVYNSASEVAQDRPAFVTVTHIDEKRRRNLSLKVGSVLEIMDTEIRQNIVGRGSEFLACKCQGKDVKVPMSFKARFSAYQDSTQYTIKDVLTRFKGGKRVKFVDEISKLPLSAEVRASLENRHYNGEAIIQSTFQQGLYVCTVEPTDQLNAVPELGRDQVIFLPLDERASQCHYQLPAGNVRSPPNNCQLSMHDLGALTQRIEIELRDQDQIVVEGGDILQNYKTIPVGAPCRGTRQYQQQDYEQAFEVCDPGQGYDFPTKPPLPPPAPFMARQSSGSSQQPPVPLITEETTDAATSACGERKENNNTTAISTVEEIPGDLSSLSVRQLAQSLRLMKMNKVADVLTEHMIDGYMFMNLHDDALKQEPLNFGTFDIEKLAFIRDGWRPKI